MKIYYQSSSIISFLVILLLFVTTLVAQYPNIQINQSDASIEPEEVTIAINPTNPLNLVAGANIDYYYTSIDGGLTWTEGNLTSDLGVWGDPCVIFDSDGNAYYVHLSNPSEGYWIDRIVVQKSTDGGTTWDSGTGIGLNPPKQQDKAWPAADFTESSYRNNLYVSWTEFDDYASTDPDDSSRIRFSRSTDSGLTWSEPITISDFGGNCLDSDSTVEGAVPAIGPNGEIYISWAGPQGIMFDKSTNGGTTFGEDIFVTSQPGGWDFNIPGIYRCNGLPETACDISNSEYRGNIYILLSDQRNGTTDTDIFLVKSTDGGQTWGNTVRVNTDTTNRQQFLPWMTVDPATGFIYVVFYDRRNTTDYGTDV
ncbi:MAG: sialidase family protein [Fidelibacterota bacterium]